MMKISFTNIIQALACHVLSLDRQNNISDYTTVITWVDNFVSLFHRRLLVNGPVWTLARYKSIYNWVKSYVLGVTDYQSAL